MKKNSNMEYVMKNLGHNGNVVDWLMCIENYFGKEQAEGFCDFFIKYHHILRTNDIRKLIHTHSLSVYTYSSKEQLAFVSIYKLINSESILVQNMEDGFKKAQKLYRKKNIELSKKIKQLGYSYSTTWANWKDKTKHDTYQRECIFVIYSEQDTPEQFKTNIINLVNGYNLKNVLITDVLSNNTPKLEITSKLFDVTTGETIKEYSDTTAEIVEEYLGNLTDTKVLFKIPYERNKTILSYDNKMISDYYSKDKQEKIRKAYPQSFNMGMLKQSLVSTFNSKSYNN